MCLSFCVSFFLSVCDFFLLRAFTPKPPHGSGWKFVSTYLLGWWTLCTKKIYQIHFIFRVISDYLIFHPNKVISLSSNQWGTLDLWQCLLRWARQSLLYSLLSARWMTIILYFIQIRLSVFPPISGALLTFDSVFLDGPDKAFCIVYCQPDEWLSSYISSK